MLPYVLIYVSLYVSTMNLDDYARAFQFDPRYKAVEAYYVQNVNQDRNVIICPFHLVEESAQGPFPFYQHHGGCVVHFLQNQPIQHQHNPPEQPIPDVDHDAAAIHDMKQASVQDGYASDSSDSDEDGRWWAVYLGNLALDDAQHLQLAFRENPFNEEPARFAQACVLWVLHDEGSVQAEFQAVATYVERLEQIEEAARLHIEAERQQAVDERMNGRAYDAVNEDAAFDALHRARYEADMQRLQGLAPRNVRDLTHLTRKVQDICAHLDTHVPGLPPDMTLRQHVCNCMGWKVRCMADNLYF